MKAVMGAVMEDGITAGEDKAVGGNRGLPADGFLVDR
jgi:hypothetical protein